MWIRTQDRTRLLNIDKFFLEGKEIKYHFDPANRFYNLGTYKTKERALEVLDEIQSVIEESDITRYEYFQGRDRELIEYTYKGTQIYQMPKEVKDE
jgi:hypothetical protein